MIRKLSWVLLLVLIAGALGGCQEDPEVETPPESSAFAASEATQAVDHTMDITWAAAFRDKSLPQGYVTPDTIAFYEPHEGSTPDIVCVPIQEVLDHVAAMERLPRTHYYEQFMEEKLQFLLHIIDYAMDMGYSRFSMPSTEIIDYDINQAHRYINYTFRMNANGLSCRTVTKLPTGDGEQTLNYTLVVLSGMELYDIDKYHAALDAAREVVDAVPKGYNEKQAALYLYHYLTENVSYDYDDYYGRDSGDADWNLVYDALINHSTVCAGYTEALYYLYNLAEIDCITVQGYIPATQWDSEGGYHIWNIARVNGEYYYFDATWDAGCPMMFYQFFGISEEQLLSYYPRDIASFDAEISPTCDKNLMDAP